MENTKEPMEAMHQFVVETTIKDIRKSEQVMRQCSLRLSDREINDLAQRRASALRTYNMVEWEAGVDAGTLREQVGV